MRRDAELRFLVLRFCPQLYLKCAAIARVDGRVDGLVAVGLGKSHVILYLARHGPPVCVDDAERRVAISDRRKNDAQRYDVVDLRDVPIFSLKLTEKAVESFHTRRH